MARLAQLRGENADAARWYTNALSLELSRSAPSHERVAWYHWQLGETAFLAGDYPNAQHEYDDALVAYPGYYRALASLGRVNAARGDFPTAINCYEAAISVLPDPTFVAALGDLYALSGRAAEARVQYDLVEFIGHLAVINGILYNRQLALFYADHDIKPQAAYNDALHEYRLRHDIYGVRSVTVHQSASRASGRNGA